MDVSEIKDLKVRRSTFVDEIISDRPNIMVRAAIPIYLLVVGVIVSASYFIQFPDVIRAEATLFSINPSKAVVSLQEGTILKINVVEDQDVDRGQVIAIIQSTANYQEIIALNNTLTILKKDLRNNKTDLLGKYFTIEFSDLGELQRSYQIFYQAYLDFANYLSDGFYIQKRSLLNQDLTYLKEIQGQLTDQKSLSLSDMELMQKGFESQEILRNKKVISELEYRTEKSKYLNKTQLIPQISASLIANKRAQNEKEREILELENTIDHQKRYFQQAVNTFNSELEEWKKQYFLISPIKGKVKFANSLRENQLIRSKQVLCYVNPKNSKYYAELAVPQYKIGKVKINQPVQLKLYSYPSEEYGSLDGTISFISNVATDSGYVAKVNLPFGLLTHHNQKIHYRDGLKAEGEIILENTTLLKRLYYALTKRLND